MVVIGARNEDNSLGRSMEDLLSFYPCPILVVHEKFNLYATIEPARLEMSHPEWKQGVPQGVGLHTAS